MNSRRESRETAFTLLFEWSFKSEESLEDIIQNAADYRELKVDKFAKELAEKAITNSESLDNSIEKYLEDWKLSRLSRVMLACLRLSVAEISYFDDIPPAVSVNEIVEIAKKYGSDEEPSFINGILGNFIADTKKE